MFAQRMEKANREEKKNLVRSSLGLSESSSAHNPVPSQQLDALRMCHSEVRPTGHSGQCHSTKH